MCVCVHVEINRRVGNVGCFLRAGLKRDVKELAYLNICGKVRQHLVWDALKFTSQTGLILLYFIFLNQT